MKHTVFQPNRLKYSLDKAALMITTEHNYIFVPLLTCLLILLTQSSLYINNQILEINHMLYLLLTFYPYNS